MTTTPEDILKKLKRTKSFDVTPENMRSFADYVIELGADEFVERWIDSTTAKPKPAVTKPKVADPRIAELTARLASFAKATKLKSGEAAVAFINFAREADPTIPEPSASATKGTGAAVKWLVAKVGVEDTIVRMSSLEERCG